MYIKHMHMLETGQFGILEFLGRLEIDQFSFLGIMEIFEINQF